MHHKKAGILEISGNLEIDPSPPFDQIKICAGRLMHHKIPSKRTKTHPFLSHIPPLFSHVP